MSEIDVYKTCIDTFIAAGKRFESIESRLEALEKKPVAEPKKMQKFIPVKNCGKCLFLLGKSTKYFCNKTERTIYVSYFSKAYPPAWCPLGETEIK